MTTSQKASISLLISFLLFGVFAFFAFTGLFNLLETRFYNPSVTAYFNRENARNAEAADIFLQTMKDRFSESLRTNETRRSFLVDRRPEDVLARSRMFTQLTQSTYGAQWVRFIDSDGSRILFSTYGPDIIVQDPLIPIYRAFDEPNIPFEMIAVQEGGAPKLTFDGNAERILFSFPLYDQYYNFWGTALFSLPKQAVKDRLIGEGRLRIGQDIAVISNPAGFLFGNFAAGENALPSQISGIWSELGSQTSRLISPDSGLSLVLVSARTSQGFFVGRLVNEELFLLPDMLKIILLATFFFTVYLTIFLLLNFRQDPVSLVQNRVKKLQLSLVEQFFEQKNETEWVRWVRELENRREEISIELKRGINPGTNNNSHQIDKLINNSWDELLGILGRRAEAEIDEEKLKAILNDILASHQAIAAPISVNQTVHDETFKHSGKKQGLLQKATAFIESFGESFGKAETIKEPELLEELEELEELDETEELEAFTLEEIADEEPTPASETRKDISEEDLKNLASQIEFAADIVPEAPEMEATEEELDEFLEIVSPFSAMNFDFSSEDNNDDITAELFEESFLEEISEQPPEKEEENWENVEMTAEDESSDQEGLIQIANRGLPVIAKPFNISANTNEIESLEPISSTEDKTTSDNNGVIEEREGVHYISEDVLEPNPKTVPGLNKEFKELVNSIIK